MASSPGRNDPCPCGSGQKFKHCCGQVGASVTAAPPPESPEIAALLALLNQGRTAEAEERAGGTAAARPQAGSLWKILSARAPAPGQGCAGGAAHGRPNCCRRMPRRTPISGRYWVSGASGRRRWRACAGRSRLSRATPRALILAANAQRVLGRAREAVTLYQWALQLEPRRYEVHNDLGNAFLDLSQRRGGGALLPRGARAEARRSAGAVQPR